MKMHVNVGKACIAGGADAHVLHGCWAELVHADGRVALQHWRHECHRDISSHARTCATASAPNTFVSYTARKPAISASSAGDMAPTPALLINTLIPPCSCTTCSVGREMVEIVNRQLG